MQKKFTTFTLLLTLISLSVYLSSCVPAQQLEDMKKKAQNCEDENSKLKISNQDLTTKNTELQANIEKMQKEISDLIKDSTEMGTGYRRLNDLYHNLTTSYDKLLANSDKMLAGSTDEQKKLLAQLNETRTDLQHKEDQMKKDQQALAEKQAKLDELTANLKDREQRVAELQNILSKKDSAVKALKDAVSNALLGFQNNGLTVMQKNGKVYVSMEERLLFASGSTIVDKRGEEALKQLSAVLEKNKDINVMVEGHTDDVPISGTLASGAKDNWELSALRATSVTKIITKYSTVNPDRITAAGRGPFVPLDAAGTADSRKKNRRTEIILSPKLDELLKVLDSN